MYCAVAFVCSVLLLFSVYICGLSELIASWVLGSCLGLLCLWVDAMYCAHFSGLKRGLGAVAFVCSVFLLFSVYMCGLPEMIASWVWLVKWYMPILDWKNDDNWEEHYRLLKWCMGTYDKRMVCELQLAEISP